MTLDEKIGQMAQPDQDFQKSAEDVKNYALGSLLGGGDSDPKAGNGMAAWTDLIDGYQKAALGARLRIPLLYGIDAVHGHNNVIGATIVPHNRRRVRLSLHRGDAGYQTLFDFGYGLRGSEPIAGSTLLWPAPSCPPASP